MGKWILINKINAFEIFGYDFMVDENFKVYLIEANTNPCLEINWSLLSSVISSLIDNTLRITLDPYFLYPFVFKESKRNVSLWDSSNTLSKFELVFDEKLDYNFLLELSKNEKHLKEEEEYIAEDLMENNSNESRGESPVGDD